MYAKSNVPKWLNELKTFNNQMDGVFCYFGMSYTLQCIKLFSKNRQRILPQYIAQQLLVNSTIHTHNTRQRTHIHYNPIRTKLEEQLINTKISSEWDKLPRSTRDSLTNPSTLSKLKHFLCKKYSEPCRIEGCHNCQS